MIPVIKPIGPCVPWSGCRNAGGYGVTYINGRQKLAHRAIYENVVGPIPPGMQLDHLCRVRECVNPSHMEPVDNRTNTLRGAGFTANNSRKTHCARGHEFTPENIKLRYRKGATSRMCLKCNAENRARYREKNPEKFKGYYRTYNLKRKTAK